MSKSNLRPWETLDSRKVYAAEPWITVSVEQVKLPDGTVVDDYHQVKMEDFVMVFAETTDGQVIVERQYKHGIRHVSLVLPAGAVGESETPQAAAQRELLEETGYVGQCWQALGTFVVHGNYGCCRGHFFRASGAWKGAEPHSGDLEEMEIVLMAPAEIADAVRKGDVASLGTAALIAIATNPLISQGGV